MAMSKLGVYVGRFMPMHLGHQDVINHMIKVHGIDRSLVVLGSSNHELTLRCMFTYRDRMTLLRAKYPDLNAVGLPDYSDDDTWMAALDDIIKTAGHDPKNTVFYSGSREDVDFFYEQGRSVHILNRYEGTHTVPVSASEVRDALHTGRRLTQMIDRDLIGYVEMMYKRNWEELKKK